PIGDSVDPLADGEAHLFAEGRVVDAVAPEKLGPYAWVPDYAGNARLFDRRPDELPGANEEAPVEPFDDRTHLACPVVEGARDVSHAVVELLRVLADRANQSARHAVVEPLLQAAR